MKKLSVMVLSNAFDKRALCVISYQRFRG